MKIDEMMVTTMRYPGGRWMRWREENTVSPYNCSCEEHQGHDDIEEDWDQGRHLSRGYSWDDTDETTHKTDLIRVCQLLAVK